MKLADLIGQPQGNPAPIMPVAYDMQPAYDDAPLPEDFFDEAIYQDQGEIPAEVQFQDNLALHMDEHILEDMGAEILQYVEDDEDLRRPWMDKINQFREQIGISDDSSYEEPFPGASSVTYPIFTKAQIQFAARALPQIFPNDPAQAVVIGVSNPILDQQCQRVEDVLNFQIQYQDKGNRKDFRKMLWWLPITGSTFRYGYHDPLLKKNMVRFIAVEDFIVPYATISLEDAPRFAHKFREKRNDLMKLMQIGYYREIDLPESVTQETDKENFAQELRDAGDGQLRVDSEPNDTSFQECVRVYIDYDLNGFEDMGQDGEPTGIALPYCVTIHKETRSILSIRRNWKEDDELKIKRIYYAHYKYQEGPGFYGSGLPHLIGSLQTATTGALRAFGDSLAFSIMPCGWKTKDAKVADTQVLSPGTFLDVDGTIDDINKMIKIAQFPPPSQQVIEYIKMLDEEAQTIVSIQDIMTGDTNPQNSPVGTTVAMIEQASKVITAQHESLYESFSEELQILFDLNYDYLPENTNFAMPGKVMQAQRADFDCKQVAVQPTADPQVSSFQQRQAIDQATMQIFLQPAAQGFARNGGYDLVRRVLTNMGVPSLDEIMITLEEFAKKQQEAQQNPPPPAPEVIKAQVSQQQAQTQAKTAETNANIAEEKFQSDEKQREFENQIKTLELQLKEKQMDLNALLTNKNIDATVFKTVTPQLMAVTDQLSIGEGEQILSEQQKRQNDEAMKHKADAMSTMQAHAQQYAQQSATPKQMAMPNQGQPAPQEEPARQGLLARIMGKIKGGQQ